MTSTPATPATPAPATSSPGLPPPPAQPVSERGETPPAGVRTMAVVRWVIVGLAGVIAVASILNYIGVRIGGSGAGAGAGAEAAQIYYCPMHPSVVRDHPGECPICGMTLVRRPAATPIKPSATMEPAGPRAAPPPPGLAAVDLSPERIQLIGMRTALVEREALQGGLTTLGTVAASERGFAQVSPRFGGFIEKLMVPETGTRVRRGQVLATLYSPEVFKAQQELLVARGWVGAAAAKSKIRPTPGAADDGDPDRDLANGFDLNARRRLELLGISPTEIEEVIRTGSAIQAMAIRSPVDGYVIGKNAVLGMAVQPGAVLFEIADLSRVWVTADVYELDLARVRVGQTARFELSSFPEEVHEGKVSFVHPTLDAPSRSLRVRLEFKNRFDSSGPRLRPGMFGTVHFDFASTTSLTVPVEAVVDAGERHYLFVAKVGGHFDPRQVDIGLRVGDRVEIRNGVQEGETVVTTGNFLIDSESRLRSAIAGNLRDVAAVTGGGGGGGEDERSRTEGTTRDPVR